MLTVAVLHVEWARHLPQPGYLSAGHPQGVAQFLLDVKCAVNARTAIKHPLHANAWGGGGCL